MRVHILASGSTGNAAFIQLGNTRVLVDAGISTRRIERGLAEIGMKAGDLDAVFITHEHTDHVKGLDVLVRRYHLPVYTRVKTWDRLKCKELPVDCCREMTQQLPLKDLEVECFSTSHDAVDPVGFCFYYQEHKVVVATDLGVVTTAVEKALTGASAVVLEANHDLEMLCTGPYPAFLKQRIKGQKGHLSNLAAGQVLARIPRDKPMQVFLAHLSQKNNRPDIAEKTVRESLLASGCRVGEEVILHRTYPDRCCSWAF